MMKTFLPSGLLAFSLACSASAATGGGGASANLAAHAFAVVALANPRAIAVDGAGNLYVGEVDAGKVFKLTPAGGVTALGAGGPAINDPVGVALGRDGTVYVSDADGNSVYRIAPGGAATLLAGPSMTMTATSLSTPTSVVADAAGNVFVANNGANAILRITPGGVASVFAGKPGATGSADGPGEVARFATPRGIAIDAAGNLYVADEGNSNIRKITPGGVVTTLAGAAGSPGSTDGTGSAARFGAPRGVAADGAGNVYVADTDNHVIRKITPAGLVATLAGRAGDSSKAPDGVAAAVRFSEPRGIAVDAAGNVYVADTGNGAVRLIPPDGVVTTIAGAATP